PMAELHRAPLNPWAPPMDPRYPIVATTFRLTEQYLSGPMSRWDSWLNELQPGMFVEMSPELAAERGIAHGDWVRISSPRGAAGAHARHGHPGPTRREDGMNVSVRPGSRGAVDSSPLQGMMIAEPPAPREEMGFFTDSTLCIGCKACEVACKQWNMLPSDGMDWSGKSYDNTLHLGATTWRHVTFTEQAVDGGIRWLFNSDVCKHCTAAPCQEACPT